MNDFDFQPAASTEASNKIFKKFRAEHARKIGPKETLGDIFERMIHVSDPVMITKIRKNLKNHHKTPIPVWLLPILRPFDPPLYTGWDEYDDE